MGSFSECLNDSVFPFEQDKRLNELGIEGKKPPETQLSVQPKHLSL